MTAPNCTTRAVLAGRVVGWARLWIEAEMVSTSVGDRRGVGGGTSSRGDSPGEHFTPDSRPVPWTWRIVDGSTLMMQKFGRQFTEIESPILCAATGDP